MTEVRSLFDLTGKVACVTGASSGLGQRCALVLLAAGAKVVGVARRAAPFEKLADHAGNAASVTGDLARRSALSDIARQVANCFGPPDILVNAAGVNMREQAAAVTDNGWDQTIGLNLATPFFLAQLFAPAMQEKGWGRILNFASLQSYRAFPGGLAYGASKGGITQLTRAMAEAWSGDGVNVNAIGPGFFQTELTAAVFADPQRANRNAEQTCIGRNGNPEDLDGPVLFLCSPASGYVTGQTLMVDGGFTAK